AGANIARICSVRPFAADSRADAISRATVHAAQTIAAATITAPAMRMTPLILDDRVNLLPVEPLPAAQRHQLGEKGDRSDAAGDGRSEDEAAALDANDDLDVLVAERRAEAVERRAEPERILQQRRDVVEENPGFRKVGHVANLRFEVVHGSAII